MTYLDHLILLSTMSQVDSQSTTSATTSTAAEAIAKLTSLGYTVTEPKIYARDKLISMENKQGLYITTDGDKAYYLDNKLHRADGPAVKWSDGGKEYYLKGKLHRTDGPAIEYADGNKVYYLDGERLSEQEYLSKTAISSTEAATATVVDTPVAEVPVITIAKTNESHTITVTYRNKVVAVINISI